MAEYDCKHLKRGDRKRRNEREGEKEYKRERIITALS